MILNFFRVKEIRELTTAFYNGKVTRDELASLAKVAHAQAEAGNETLREQIRFGVAALVDNVKVVAARLNFKENFPVAGVGGMFRGRLMKEYFNGILNEKLPDAVFTEPRFSPTIGALLLAFRSANLEINENILSNLENSPIR